MPRSNAATVEEYVAGLPADRRATIAAVLASTSPDAWIAIYERTGSAEA